MTIKRTGPGRCAAILSVCALLMAPAPILASAQHATTLRVAYTSDIDSVNPFQATSLVATQLGRLMYEFLTVNGADDSSPEPGLAQRWEVAPDNLTWTFHLRGGMRWSDGQPITAKDVEFTYNKIMTDPDAAAANGVAVTNYESIAAPDENTVVIRTRQPQASMLQSEIPIVPEHVWRHVNNHKHLTNSDSFPVVGSGPFVLAGYQEAQSVTLQANNRFWRGRPAIETLRFVKYESTEGAVAALRKGEVDLVYRLTAAQYKALRDMPGITTNAGDGRKFVEIIFNLGTATKDGRTYGNGNPVLKDVGFRTALAHAINLKTIVDKVKQGLAEPATEIIPSSFPGWTFRPPASRLRGFDLSKANALLDQAGYAKAANGMRTDKQGKDITLRLLVTSDNTDNQQIAEYLKGWFKEIGVGLTPQFKSSNQLSDDTSAGNFDLAFSGWSVSPDPDFMLAQETCDVVGTDLSDSNFCDAGYDQLYREQQSELDKTRRMELVRQAQSILYDNVSAIVLTYDKQLEAYRSDRFNPFRTQPAGHGIIANQSGYWSYYQASPAGTGQATSADGSGPSAGTIAGLAGTAVALLACLVWVARRRKTTAGERE